MEKKENISRREALKRMSKTALALAAVSMFPCVNALANEQNVHTGYTDSNNYSNYNDYKNYGNYNDYKNYSDYSNYDNYNNYNDYYNCH